MISPTNIPHDGLQSQRSFSDVAPAPKLTACRISASMQPARSAWEASCGKMPSWKQSDSSQVKGPKLFWPGVGKEWKRMICERTNMECYWRNTWEIHKNENCELLMAGLILMWPGQAIFHFALWDEPHHCRQVSDFFRSSMSSSSSVARQFVVPETLWLPHFPTSTTPSIESTPRSTT